jgi:hypothetical protein
MDALVAEQVMGVRLIRVDGADFLMNPDGSGVGGIRWSPSTDISAAWSVVEKMRAKYPVRIDYDSPPDDQWICVFGDAGGFIGVEKTAPLAICKAALLATETRSHE